MSSTATACVRDATARVRTATLERVRNFVKLAREQANASRVKEEDGKHPGSLRGLTACSPMTVGADPTHRIGRGSRDTLPAAQEPRTTRVAHVARISGRWALPFAPTASGSARDHEK